MSEHFKLKGVKFYRYLDEESETPAVVRLLEVVEDKKEYKVLDCTTKDEYGISFKELEEKWIKLNPDGIVAFVLCTAKDNQDEEVPDLMVNLHLIDKDSGRVEQVPYCVCRQAVIDIFALLQQSKHIAGMSISRDTCPPEVDFRSCCRYSQMAARREMIAVYMDDHIDDILELFDNEPYNRRLELIKSRDKMGIPGYQTNLSDFLKTNYFMYDFHAGFGIHELDFEKLDFEDDTTNRVLTDYIISITQEVPTRLYPIPYTKYIDLHDIKRKYILICPSSFKYPDGNIILLAYDVSQTISYKDLINRGKNPKKAKQEVMKQLGWS